MRIVAGQWGGRKLHVPKGQDIRPTSDKVRGAVFNMLRGFDALQDAQVLDAFCGTGALGLEALSQGAARCVFMDKARSSLDLARHNAEQFGASDICDFYLLDSTKDVAFQNYHEVFNLIFLDPPYRKNIIYKILKNKNFLESIRQDAILVCETEKDFNFAPLSQFETLQEKLYGDTKIVLLRHYSKD